MWTTWIDRTMRRAGPAALAAFALVGAVALGPQARAASAQQKTVDEPATVSVPRTQWRSSTSGVSGFFSRRSPNARLGVFLKPGCEIGSGVEGDCPAPPVVAAVVDDAPAAEAGIEPGDTLLSLDGVAVRSQAGRRRMAQLEEGVPVRLELGREGGRETIRVTPTARPATAVFEMNGTAWRTAAPTPPSDVHVYRLRSDDGGVAEFHLAPTPEVATSPGGFVVFGEDDEGNLRVTVGDADLELRTLDGQRVELAELEEHLRGLKSKLAQQPDGPQTIETEIEVRSTDGTGGEGRQRLIIENAPLANRLQSVHNQTLVEARARIDSVVKRQVELARRGELPPGAAAGYAYVVPSKAPPSVSLFGRRLPEGMEQRLAGAEFWALTPELAENFAVDEGLLVLRVVPGTPAHRLGLRGGDVVTEVGGHKSLDINTFRHLVAESLASQNALEVKWNRKGVELAGKLTSR
jgi:S1-C subfamily serine protease